MKRFRSQTQDPVLLVSEQVNHRRPMIYLQVNERKAEGFISKVTIIPCNSVERFQITRQFCPGKMLRGASETSVSIQIIHACIME